MDATVETPKSFQWSYSRLKAFEDCPRRFHETQIKKAWKEEKSDQLIYGDVAHRALANALRNNTPLSSAHKIHQRWVDKVAAAEGELLVESECQWACNRDLKPTAWFAEDVWLRVIADAVKLNPPNMWVIDWKTGKSANGDPVQLVLTSLMAFLQFPEVQQVTSDFIWLQETVKPHRSSTARIRSNTGPISCRASSGCGRRTRTKHFRRCQGGSAGRGARWRAASTTADKGDRA